MKYFWLGFKICLTGNVFFLSFSQNSAPNKFELYLPAPAPCCGNCREENKDTSSP